MATIVPEDGQTVWGALWELDKSHMNTLDKQEGVPRVYHRKHVKVGGSRKLFLIIKEFSKVQKQDGSVVDAITYFMVKPLVEDRRPSALYHGVILEGAREHCLPEHYVDKLKQIEHNGETTGDGTVRIVLGRF